MYGIVSYGKYSLIPWNLFANTFCRKIAQFDKLAQA